jgi:hypothetical protein
LKCTRYFSKTEKRWKRVYYYFPQPHWARVPPWEGLMAWFIVTKPIPATGGDIEMKDIESIIW